LNSLEKELHVNKTRILITGANSFVGVNFRKFSQFRDTAEVSLLETKPEDIDFKKYDVVLHLAAIVHQSKKISEEQYFKVNRDLCLRVAEQSRKSGIRQFIFLSTLKVYGGFEKGYGLRNEDSECFPEDAYGKSKYAAEKELRKLEDESFTVSIIRTPLVYGEGVKANMISLVQLVERFPILPLGKIHNRRNFTFAENLVGYIDRIILKRASGIFITMDEKAQSTTEIVNYISKSLGKNVHLFKLPGMLLKLGNIFASDKIDRLFGSLEFENIRTRQELEYNPPFSTEEGIEKMVKFYLLHKKHNQQKAIK
jgi:nucleoside-diphosphate-sugar epimerase